MANPRVFLDASFGSQQAGRIVVELFANKAPTTAENFKSLCTCGNIGGIWRKSPHFKGLTIDRGITGLLCHFEDPRSKSIYGFKFVDANSANGSPTSICIEMVKLVQGGHVVFGQVVEGSDVVKGIAQVGSRGGMTSNAVVIADCGQLYNFLSM